MNNSNLDEQIKNLKVKKESLKNEMEIACQKFLNAVEAFAANWFTIHVDQAIITSNIRDAKLNKLLLRHQDQIEKLPLTINETVGLDEYWPHQVELPERPNLDFDLNKSYGKNTPKLHDGICMILGGVGGLLHDFGFINLKESDQWEVKKGSDPIYKGSYRSTENMNSAFKDYKKMYAKLIELNKAIKDKNKAKTKKLRKKKA